MNRKLTIVLLLTVVDLMGVSGALAATPVDYSATIQPIFNASCTGCHSGSSPSAGIDLTSYNKVIAATFEGSPIVIPGNATNSTLYQAVTGTGGMSKMPPGGSLTTADIQSIADWINQGALSTPPTATPAKTFNISGFKINNATGSGVQGWNITLKNTTIQTSMLTGTDGSYKFMNLVNGTYNVTEELQEGWTNVSPMSQQVTISGADKININFTNQPPKPVGTFNVSGFKVNDTNGDNIWDAGEMGIENWNIRLLNATTGTQINSTSTNAQGFYEFMNLAPGVYNVTEEMKTGFTPSGATFKVITIENMDVTDVNFLNHVTVPSPQKFNISGFKVNDTNGNNVWEKGEMGIENWNIKLLNATTGAQIASTSTDASGFYELMDLAPGVYNVTEEMKTGFTPSGATFKVVTVENMDVTDVNFLNHVTVPAVTNTISGFKINDLNGNGKQDAGENGLPGWNIKLTGIVPETAGINMETTTDDNGFYSFENLPAGMYLVVETVKGDYVPSGPPVLVVTLENGTNSMNNNFMNRPVSSLVPDLSGLFK